MASFKKSVNFSIGIDIESINRFEKLDPIKDKLFLNKIFTKNELKYCFTKKNFAQHLSGRFAAKEAVIKALYSAGKKKLNYKDIEIINEKNGTPKVKTGKNNDFNIKISLSHCRDKAVAVAALIA